MVVAILVEQSVHCHGDGRLQPRQQQCRQQERQHLGNTRRPGRRQQAEQDAPTQVHRHKTARQHHGGHATLEEQLQIGEAVARHGKGEAQGQHHQGQRRYLAPRRNLQSQRCRDEVQANEGTQTQAAAPQQPLHRSAHSVLARAQVGDRQDHNPYGQSQAQVAQDHAVPRLQRRHRICEAVDPVGGDQPKVETEQHDGRRVEQWHHRPSQEPRPAAGERQGELQEHRNEQQPGHLIAPIENPVQPVPATRRREHQQDEDHQSEDEVRHTHPAQGKAQDQRGGQDEEQQSHKEQVGEQSEIVAGPLRNQGQSYRMALAQDDDLDGFAGLCEPDAIPGHQRRGDGLTVQGQEPVARPNAGILGGTVVPHLRHHQTVAGLRPSETGLGVGFGPAGDKAGGTDEQGRDGHHQDGGDPQGRRRGRAKQAQRAGAPANGVPLTHGVRFLMRML